MTQAYPLAWPERWPRTPLRKPGHFGVSELQRGTAGGSWRSKRSLSIADAVKRVRYELDRLDVDVANDMIISTNLRLNMQGMPRGDQGEPGDPGVAVYWQVRKGPNRPMRVMAIDTYYRVADNLGAVAATLEAMRAIARHGGAVILDRAFQGFEALPAPKSHWDVLGLKPGACREDVQRAWRAKAATAHPDRDGGSTAAMAELNAARDAALREATA